MSQYGSAAAAATKHPPWVRTGQNISMSVGQTGQMPPSLMANAIPPIANASVLQYPQQQVFQGQMGIQQATMNMGGMTGIPTGSVAPMQASIGTSQMYGAVGPVSYPTRALNSAAFQNTPSSSSGATAPTQQAATNGKQRVFTGTVTKVQDNFGFVDEDVFFQSSCCVNGRIPQVGDRVLVEAMYNANMPFKWNAKRIQVLPMSRDNPINPRGFSGMAQGSTYNAVPPPSENTGGQNRFSGGGSRFSGGNDRRDRGRDRGRQQRDDPPEVERKRRRDDREKEHEKEKDRVKSPPRKRSKSPVRSSRRQRRVIPRYSVQVPKINLDSTEADVMQIRKRYTNMYIPSDFFSANLSWVSTFPLGNPISLDFPCSFHVMHRDVDPILPNTCVLEPSDVDYLYSAKVMLLNTPGMDELYGKCISLAEDKDKEGSRSTDDDQYSHPARLIQFLVGLRGKNETMAIGGPWSPSMDGENPESDPGVLIKTATRNCKALTGIDLSSCTQWFRFLEIFYHRAETIHKGKTQPARVETVVLFVPDVWSCLPTRLEWDGLQLNYQKQLAKKLNKDETTDEKEDETEPVVPKREPRHHTELDPKNMKVNELREELEARTLSPKGLKSQLVARLQKVIKTEADEETAKKNSPPKVDKKEEEEKKKKEEEEKKKYDERDRALLEKRYKLPDSPHILVHPNRAAKSGKFDCSVMSLSSLLGYRQDDTKEHSFEVSLFAELFNEMLMRDFGFNIYCSVVRVPEKPKEEKEDKERKKEKPKEKDKDINKDDKEQKEKEKDKDVKDKETKERRDEDMDEDEDMDDDDEEKERKDKKEEERKKNERLKLYTADPLLLLSFSYFDTTRCGYIFDKDLEDLLFSLGLLLSRAQVKKLIQKVVTRDSLHYRKLTDKPKEETNGDSIKPVVDDITLLSQGNRQLLPLSGMVQDDSPTNKKIKKEKQESETLKSGFVMYNGSLVDIGKLMDQLKRSETSRVEIEKSLSKVRQDHGKVKENLQRVERHNRDLSMDLRDFKERLANANSELCNMDGKARMYHNALTEIHDKIKPLLKVPSVSVERTADIPIVEVGDKDDQNDEEERLLMEEKNCDKTKREGIEKGGSKMQNVVEEIEIIEEEDEATSDSNNEKNQLESHEDIDELNQTDSNQKESSELQDENESDVKVEMKEEDGSISFI